MKGWAIKPTVYPRVLLGRTVLPDSRAARPPVSVCRLMGVVKYAQVCPVGPEKYAMLRRVSASMLERPVTFVLAKAPVPAMETVWSERVAKSA